MLQFFHWLSPFVQGVAFGVLAMTIHELGHIAAALVLGVHIKHVGLRWKGLYTVREAGPPLKNMFVSLAGPGINFFFCFFLPLHATFALANFCIGLGNLIPIRGSDGHRFLLTWRMMLEDKDARAAEK
jgi:Zn-dependent protease